MGMKKRIEEKIEEIDDELRRIDSLVVSNAKEMVKKLSPEPHPYLVMATVLTESEVLLDMQEEMKRLRGVREGLEIAMGIIRSK